MKKTVTTFGLVGLFTAMPLAAQDTAQDAMEDAIEAATDAAEQAANEAPARDIQQPYPPGRDSGPFGPRPPQLIDFQTLMANPDDYPVAAWAADEEGSVYYSLTIDVEGNVTDCSVLESSGSALLDAKTCEIAMERGKFDPALDEDGNPIAGEHRDFQVWEKQELEFPGTATIHVEFTVNERGETADCEVIEISGEISERTRQTFEREPCPGANRRPRALYRDENGNPVSKRVNLSVNVIVSDLEE